MRKTKLWVNEKTVLVAEDEAVDQALMMQVPMKMMTNQQQMNATMNYQDVGQLKPAQI